MTTGVDADDGRGSRARGVEGRHGRAASRQARPGGRPYRGNEPEDEGKGDPAEHETLPRMKKPAGIIPSGRNFEHHLRTNVYHLFSKTSSRKCRGHALAATA
jgi:hypothetical protein